MSNNTEPREPVNWFAKQMEYKLSKNDHKGGWEKLPLSKLLQLLKDEVQELEDEINSPLEVKRIDVIKECADVANFAMMIADNVKFKN